MDLTLNIIPGPLPDICESAHERPAPPSRTHAEQPRLSHQPKVAIIKLPCESAPRKLPVTNNTDMKNELGNTTTGVPVSSSFEPPVGALTSLGKPVFAPHKASPPSRKPSTPNASSNRPPLPPTIPTPPKYASKPEKIGTCYRQKKSTSLPSNSNISSCVSNNSTNRRLRVSPKTPTQRPAPSPTRKHTMSEQAAETVRVMEWAKSLVKSAEKRVRQEERAAHEKEMFKLRMGKWEAEMKVQKLEENAANCKKKKESPRADECFNRIIFWKGDESRMGQCKNVMRDAQKQCRRGLAVVLER